MLHKKSNKEMARYGLHNARGKGLTVGEQWMYNKL